MGRAALTLAVISSFAAAAPEVVRYPGGPPETATLAPGPNVETAQLQCGMCHSVDYITTQPRNFADPRVVWTAEVAKMRKAYGAPLTDEDAAKVVDYLVATYGHPSP
ncbi:MAG TPA: cytochrome c [Caulobacteraceae bacterium]|jgi:mono/diheme cytochrome c family protein